MTLPFTLERLNAHSVLFSLPLPVTPHYPTHFRHLQDALHRTYPHCRDTVAGYRNLLAIFGDTAPHDAELAAFLANLPDAPADTDTQTLTIPVCYHPELAPDLETLAQSKHLTVAELIALHTAPTYTVHAIGFIPGFPFLGDVDERIAAPRHGEPRREVAAGSVGIAGRQTGIYPKNSPGGWQLIGRTPLTLYQPESGLYSRFSVGMHVRFTPISLDDYHARRL